MKRIPMIVSLPIFFLLGYSIPEVIKGNFIWLIVFIPGLVFAIWRFIDILKNQKHV